MSSLGLLETAASPKNFLILCSDMNLGLKMEKVQQGSFLFIFMLYHFEYLFFFWGGRAWWAVMLLELAVPVVVACQGVVAELWKQLMGRSQQQFGKQSVSWLKSLMMCQDCYE